MVTILRDDRSEERGRERRGQERGGGVGGEREEGRQEGREEERSRKMGGKRKERRGTGYRLMKQEEEATPERRIRCSSAHLVILVEQVRKKLVR